MAMSAPEVFVDEPRLVQFVVFHRGLGALHVANACGGADAWWRG